MKDTVLLGNGNSRYLKSVSNFLSLYPTYNDFVAAIVAGTLPVDFNGVNAAGCAQVGTSLSKANLLTDATATALGLSGNDPTVNDALSALAGRTAADKRAFYAVCSTAADTQAKVVTIEGITALTAGVSVRVKFANAQTYNGNPTLNVNSLGAAAIKRYGSENAGQYEWTAGAVLDMVYDGTNWVIVDGAYDRANSIPFGSVDGTSTSTAFTATIPGITELRDGVCMWLRNGVVTSAEGFTIDVNNLGAKPCYGSLAAATRSTTIFNINYTMLFIYNSTRVTGGCWDVVYGYDSNTTYTPVKLGFAYGTCSTAAATAAKTVSLSSYALTANTFVAIKFTNAVPAGATLNINSKGAKAMYFRGAAITADVIKAGDTAIFAYSTYYHLIAIDRWGNDFSGKADKVSSPTNGNFAALDANGNLTDSGKKAADFQTPLPSQSGNSGKYLTTNGSALSWGTPSGGGGSTVYTDTITTTTSWSGNGPYTQTVTLAHYTPTAYSKVDIQPDATAIAQLISDGVQALYISNNNGTLTMYAVGAAPTAALTLQVTITETEAAS